MVMLYADTLRRVGDPGDHVAIAEALANTSRATSRGYLVLDPLTYLALQGDDYIPIQFYQIQNGERVLFHPQKYETGSFKVPPWMSKQTKGKPAMQSGN